MKYEKYLLQILKEVSRKGNFVKFHAPIEQKSETDITVKDLKGNELKKLEATIKHRKGEPLRVKVLEAHKIQNKAL